MPKIKLKPNLPAVEIGLGNLACIKIAPGETLDVAENLLEDLTRLDLFEVETEKEIDANSTRSAVDAE